MVTSSRFLPQTGIKVTFPEVHGQEVAELEMESRLSSQPTYFITMQIASVLVLSKENN